MATDIEKMLVSISAEISGLKRGLGISVAETKRAAKAMNDNLNEIGQGVDPLANAQGNMERSVRQMRAMSANLSFQLNDVVSGFQMGQRASQIFAQQGGQIVQLFGQLSGAGLKFGDVLRGLVNWPNLILLGFTALTFAANKFFEDTEKSAADTAEELQKVAKGFDDVAKRMPGSAIAQGFAKQSSAAAREAQLLADRELLMAQATENANAAFSELLPQIANVALLMSQAGDVDGSRRLTAAQNELSKAIERGSGVAEAAAEVMKELQNQTVQYSEESETLRRELANARSGFIASDKAVEDIGISLAAVRQEQNAVTEAMEKGAKQAAAYGTALLQVKNPAQLLAEALRTLQGSLPDFSAGGALLQGVFAMPGLAGQAATATPSAAKEFLKTKAASEKVRSRIDQMDDEFATALAKLFTALPADAKILSGVRTTAEQAAIYASGVRPAAKPGHSRHERGAAVDITGVSPDVLQAAVNQMKELETLRRIGDPMHVQMAGTMKKAEDELADSMQRRAESYADLIQNLEQENEVLALQAEQLGINATAQDQVKVANEAAVEALQAEQQLRSQGIELSSEEEAKILSLATAHANLKVALEEQKTATDEARKSDEKRQREMDQMYGQIGGVFKSAIGGFISDLRNGVDAGEAFNNMLGRIADSLIDMALEAAFSSDAMKGLFGGLFGGLGGGSFPAVPVGLYEKGGIVGRPKQTARVDPRRFIGAPSFAHGGTVSGGVPIIAHPGELIIPKAMVNRARNVRGGGGDVTNNIGGISIDMARTGFVTASTEDGKELGRKMEAAVAVVLVKESRPGGLLRRQANV